MALRRLFSGWLSALAALARSVAQALERAAEDRPASSPDPVMDALAERYPGAPAHWLAHVAERTAQLAEAGEVPLSLNSDPAIWPPIQRQASPPPAQVMDRAPVSRAPAPTRPLSRDEATVPTLAALRERPSEIWRRPDLAPKRRPVFASPSPAVGPEPPARSAPGPNAGARRPRSPLSVKADAPSRPASETVRGAAVSEAPMRQAAWADTPRDPVETSGMTAVPPIQASSMGADPGVRTVAEERETRNPDVHGGRIQPAALSRDRRSSIVKTLVREPVRVARFFAPRPKPVTRAASTEDDRTVLDRAGAGERGPVALAAAASVIFPRASRDLATSAAPPSLPDTQRPISRALAALQARSRAERPPVTGPSATQTPLTADGMSVEAPWRAAPPGFGPQMATRPGPASAFSRPDHDQSTALIRSVEPRAKPAVPKASTVPRGAFALHGEATGRGGRATSTAPDAAPSRAAARRFAGSPPDDRWPQLPPAAFASPPGVAAPPPRWEELAREQEEGRWSV